MSANTITRVEFLRSRFYQCALSFNKRNELRLKNIRDMLEKMDLKSKGTRNSSNNTVRTVTKVEISAADPSDPRTAGRGRRDDIEDKAILSADKENSDWIFDEPNNEYVLSFDDIVVMKVPADIFQRLKPYQRDAVKWIASVGPTGGILADDMGLGKTFMAIASIGARMRVKRVRMALIVAPVSVLAGWTKEANKFLYRFVANVRVIKVHGGTVDDRKKSVRKAWKESTYERPHVIISSWRLVASGRNLATFSSPVGRSWDYVILDEAHVIKDPKSDRSKFTRKICHKPATSRLLLTGTPMQNNMNELWSIVDMATRGQVLGKFKVFKKKYGKPIEDARCRNASLFVIKQAKQANDELQEALKPYILRRKKIDCLSHELLPKREICVSDQQKRMYKKIVEENGFLAQNMFSTDKEVAKNATMGAFQVLAKLIKLCGHPLRLLTGVNTEFDLTVALEHTSLTEILSGSKKLELVVHMLKGFKSDGEKVLLFSQSTKSMDIIQHVLKKLGNISIGRIDG